MESLGRKSSVSRDRGHNSEEERPSWKTGLLPNTKSKSHFESSFSCLHKFREWDMLLSYFSPWYDYYTLMVLLHLIQCSFNCSALPILLLQLVSFSISLSLLLTFKRVLNKTLFTQGSKSTLPIFFVFFWNALCTRPLWFSTLLYCVTGKPESVQITEIRCVLFSWRNSCETMSRLEEGHTADVLDIRMWHAQCSDFHPGIYCKHKITKALKCLECEWKLQPPPLPATHCQSYVPHFLLKD